ncbi:MAG: glycine cleavage system aminomethyltransferase GcvT [Actinobacteria bacterium]|nr:glycine cleavage system aminomethyltransferase GcvT [Actinomycetota bacterium]
MTRSPLHDQNRSLGARFVEFGGWEMPLQYGSVLAEHRAVRDGVGVFDVSHLGRFALGGAGAGAALRRLLCNDIERIGPGRCQYTLVLDQTGGILDDLIVWRWSDTDFWVLPNAANHERVMALFAAEPGCRVEDVRHDTVLLAVQGPSAPNLIRDLVGDCPARLHATTNSWSDAELRIAGTGYTGEPGVEVCTDPATGSRLLEALVDAGAVPAGLGARDTLRLESGFPLWGQDIDATTTPIEAGLGFAVSFGHDFVGEDALIRQVEGGTSRRLVGFVLSERGVPRHGHRMRGPVGSEGLVTSGNISPMLGVGIGLGYLSPPPRTDDMSIEIEVRDRWLAARLKKPPFHLP